MPDIFMFSVKESNQQNISRSPVPRPKVSGSEYEILNHNNGYRKSNNVLMPYNTMTPINPNNNNS